MKAFPSDDQRDKSLILDFLNKFDSKYPLKNIKPIEMVLRSNYVNHINRITKDYPDFEPIDTDENSLYQRFDGSILSHLVMAVEKKTHLQNLNVA